MMPLRDVELLSAKQIKEALTDAHVDFSDCFEKSELVARLQSHIAQENADTVLKAKACANESYSRGSYALAVRHYDNALGCLKAASHHAPLTADERLLAAQVHSNRSLAQLRLGQVHAALADARVCVAVCLDFPKGYLRLANALAAHARHAHALAALRQGICVLEAGAEDSKLKGDLEQRVAEEAEICRMRGLDVEGVMWEDFMDGEDSSARPPHTEGSALLHTLSDDALVEIMGLGLGPVDVCRMARCCRQLRGVCVLLRDTSSKLWRAVCERTWPDVSALHAAPHRDWRALCEERHTVDARWRTSFSSSHVVVFKAEESPVFNVHRQGDLLASAEDNCIKLWDIPRKRQTKVLEASNVNSKMCLGVWLHPSQQTVLSGGAEGDIKVWDVRRGTCSRVLAGHAGPIVSLHADEEAIYSTSFDGSCRVWSWQGRNVQTLLGHVGHVCGLSAQPDDRDALWTGADDGLVKRWDVERGACVLNLEAPGQEQHGSVWCVQATSRGVLVSASTDANVRIWDTSSGTAIARLEGHDGAVAGLHCDPDKIVSCAFDGTVRLWDWKMMRCRGCVRVDSAHGGHLPMNQYRRCTRLQVSDSQILVGCIDGNIYQIDIY